MEMAPLRVARNVEFTRWLAMAFQAALLDFHGRHVPVHLRSIVLRDARIIRKRWVGVERVEPLCLEFVGFVFGIARIEVHKTRGVT